MEKLVLLMLMVATCFAAPQDLSGKVFVFPKEDNVGHAKLTTPKKDFSAVTVCQRFLSDLKRNYALFSLATSAHTNDFVIFKLDDVIRVHVRDASTDFLSLMLPANTWHSLCTTWSSDNGLAQLWLDGRPTIKRFVHSGQHITGVPSTILGQEQDSYGGGFDATQSFVGMLTQVHMWDYVLSEAEIIRYVRGDSFTPGNVFNWRAMEYDVHGKAIVDELPNM